MTREELLRKIESFEDLCSSIYPLNLVYLLFPILVIVWTIRTFPKKQRRNKAYKELINDLLSFESQLDPKEFMGWRKRVISAYQG